MKIHGKQILSFDLNAGVTCPGSKDNNGNVVEVCSSCYAKKGPITWPASKALRDTNLKGVQSDKWEDTMVELIKGHKYFRFLTSGDVYSRQFAIKIKNTIKRSPSTQFWLPTRSTSIPAINSILKEISALPNVALRPSADNIGLNNKERPGVNSYVINLDDIFEAKKQGIIVCPVSTNSTRTSCDDCTVCYTDAKVAYVVH